MGLQSNAGAGKRSTHFQASDEINIKLNEYGAEGWELIKVMPTTRRGWIIGWGSYTDSLVLFKHAKE